MALMSSGIYDALVAAGAPEEKARKAAEEIASTNHEQVNLRGEFEKIRGEFSTVKWMLGTMIVMMAGLYASIFAFAINHATFH